MVLPLDDVLVAQLAQLQLQLQLKQVKQEQYIMPAGSFFS